MVIMRVRKSKKTEESNPGQSVASNEVVTGHFRAPLSQRIPLLKIFANQKAKRLSLFVLVLALLAGVAFAVRYYLDQSSEALRVQGYSLDRRTYNRLISEAQAVGTGKTEARKILIEAYASRAAADSAKVSYQLDDSELSLAAKQQFELELESPVSEFQKLAVTPDMVKKYVEVAELGGYQAAVVEFPFSRYIIGSPTDKVDRNKIGNTQEISSDITYAESQYKKFQTILDQKQKTPAEVVGEVKADNRLIYGQTSNPSEVDFFSTPSADPEQVNQVELKLWQDIQAASESLNKVRVSNVEVTYPPSEYGVESLNLQTDSGTRIGWRLIYVIKKIDRQQGVLDQYQKLIKEYSGV